MCNCFVVGSIWLKVAPQERGCFPWKSLYTSDGHTQCLQTLWSAADWNLTDPRSELDDCSIKEALVPDGELQVKVLLKTKIRWFSKYIFLANKLQFIALLQRKILSVILRHCYLSIGTATALPYGSRSKTLNNQYLMKRLTYIYSESFATEL